MSAWISLPATIWGRERATSRFNRSQPRFPGAVIFYTMTGNAILCEPWGGVAEAESFENRLPPLSQTRKVAPLLPLGLS